MYAPTSHAENSPALTLSKLRSPSLSCFWDSERLGSGARVQSRVPRFRKWMLSSEEWCKSTTRSHPPTGPLPFPERGCRFPLISPLHPSPSAPFSRKPPHHVNHPSSPTTHSGN